MYLLHCIDFHPPPAPLHFNISEIQFYLTSVGFKVLNDGIFGLTSIGWPLRFNKICSKVEDALSPFGPAISSLDISLEKQKKSRRVA